MAMFNSYVCLPEGIFRITVGEDQMRVTVAAHLSILLQRSSKCTRRWRYPCLRLLWLCATQSSTWVCLKTGMPIYSFNGKKNGKIMFQILGSMFRETQSHMALLEKPILESWHVLLDPAHKTDMLVGGCLGRDKLSQFCLWSKGRK